MMRKASRYHVARGLAVAVALVLLGLGGWEANGRLQARRLRDNLLGSVTPAVPGIIKDMAPYRRWLVPLLREAYDEARENKDDRTQLHASLALLPVDPGQVDYLYGRLLRARPEEIYVLTAALRDHREALRERLWSVLADRRADPDRRLRAACALAWYAPQDPRWQKVSGDVAEKLVTEDPLVLKVWAEALRPVRGFLLPPLAAFLEDEKRGWPEKGLSARLYGTYAEGRQDAFAPLDRLLARRAAPGTSEEAKLALARRQANVGVALLIMGRGEKVWPLLKHSPDPTRRSYLIERLGAGAADPRALIARLDREPNVSVKRAILLSLGGFGPDRLPLGERQNLLPRLVRLYRDDSDPGIHGAAEWLLRQWGQERKVKEVDRGLATGKVEGGRRWYVNRQGQTMVVVDRPGVVWLGEGTGRHRRRIDRSYAIASKEVTLGQFLRFRKGHKGVSQVKDGPVDEVSWYDAAAYCNWLSEREGIPRGQWCYLPNAKGELAEGMSSPRTACAGRATGCRRSGNGSGPAGRGQTRRSPSGRRRSCSAGMPGILATRRAGVTRSGG
jgi:hypothetical protein